MLTGRPAFSGETVTDVLTAVVTREPDLGALPSATPLHIRGLLRRCLQKDPKQRLRDIGEARIAIDAARPAETSRRSCFVRHLNQLKAAGLAGTGGASHPFFSPDGLWVAFFADGKLKKVSVTGGAPLTVCDAPNGRGGSWSEDGTIVFTPEARSNIWRVASAGGKPEAVTTLQPDEITQRWPQALPGGKAVLWTSAISTIAGSFDDANIVVQPLPAGVPRIVVRGGYFGRYLPSGHLVYIRSGTLFAARFGLDRLELSSNAVPAVEGVTANPMAPGFGAAQFAVAANGTLAYLAGPSLRADVPIALMHRDGKATPLRSAPANWTGLLFSPDGGRLAMDIADGKQRDVWIYVRRAEFERTPLARQRSASEINLRPQLEEPAGHDGQRFLPVRSVAIVLRQDGARVQHIVDVDECLYPSPRAHPERFGQPQIQLVDAVAK